MKTHLKVYVGYDPREHDAWMVCRHSLLRHATGDLSVYPLKQASLRELGLYWRAVDTRASTEFSLTRFLTPYLAATHGWSVFVDCDFLFTRDLSALVAGLDQTKAAHVVKHDYTPRFSQKMDGVAQTTYPRKNWSSFIVFNGAHPSVRGLTPAIVNSESPEFLHRMHWAADADIGALDPTWNHLVGEYDPPAHLPAAIHFTNGGPWFDTIRTEYDDLWRAEFENCVARNAEASAF